LRLRGSCRAGRGGGAWGIFVKVSRDARGAVAIQSPVGLPHRRPRGCEAIMESVILQDAWLFDLHAAGDRMVLWFITDGGGRLRLEQRFTPELFLEGPGEQLRACVRALEQRGDAEPIGWTERLDF